MSTSNGASAPDHGASVTDVVDGASVTSVRSFLPVVGDQRALALTFAADPQRWLPAARHDPDGGITMIVRAGSLRRTVAVEVGSTRRAADTHWRSFAWTPVAASGAPPSAIERFLPHFSGDFGLHIPAAGPSTLVLDGRYHPPGGKLGATADAAGLRRVANATVRRMLQDVAGLLTAEALLVAEDAGRR